MFNGVMFLGCKFLSPGNTYTFFKNFSLIELEDVDLKLSAVGVINSGFDRIFSPCSYSFFPQEKIP